MSDACQKCGYERKPTDPGPLTACPSCGAVYAKVAAALKSGASLRDAAGNVRAAPVAPSAAPPPASPSAAAPGSALTSCRTCGKEVSRTARTCPHCGEEWPAGVPVPVAAPPAKRVVRKGFVNSLLVFLGVLFVLGKCAGGPVTTTASSPREFDQFDAFELCKAAIKLVARDGETAQIPDVPTEGAYYFRWDITTQRLRLRNGLGLEVPASAGCKVDPVAKRVTRLSLNGETLWER